MSMKKVIISNGLVEYSIVRAHLRDSDEPTLYIVFSCNVSSSADRGLIDDSPTVLSSDQLLDFILGVFDSTFSK